MTDSFTPSAPPESHRHEFRTFAKDPAPDRPAGSLHAGARLPGRGRIRPLRDGPRQPVEDLAEAGSPQGRGARSGPVEPVPAARVRRTEPGPEQPRVRATDRDHGPHD